MNSRLLSLLPRKREWYDDVYLLVDMKSSTQAESVVMTSSDIESTITAKSTMMTPLDAETHTEAENLVMTPWGVGSSTETFVHITREIPVHIDPNHAQGVSSFYLTFNFRRRYFWTKLIT